MKGKMKRIGIPLAAAAFSAGLSMVSFGATGWVQEDGEWCYYNSDGSKATDEFKKSGDNWFYLDSDGIMLRSSIVRRMTITIMSIPQGQWFPTNGEKWRTRTAEAMSRIPGGIIFSPTERR